MNNAAAASQNEQPSLNHAQVDHAYHASMVARKTVLIKLVSNSLLTACR